MDAGAPVGRFADLDILAFCGQHSARVMGGAITLTLPVKNRAISRGSSPVAAALAQ